MKKSLLFTVFYIFISICSSSSFASNPVDSVIDKFINVVNRSLQFPAYRNIRPNSPNLKVNALKSLCSQILVEVNRSNICKDKAIRVLVTHYCANSLHDNPASPFKKTKCCADANMTYQELQAIADYNTPATKNLIKSSFNPSQLVRICQAVRFDPIEATFFNCTPHRNSYVEEQSQPTKSVPVVNKQSQSAKPVPVVNKKSQPTKSVVDEQRQYRNSYVEEQSQPTKSVS